MELGIWNRVKYTKWDLELHSLDCSLNYHEHEVIFDQCHHVKAKLKHKKWKFEQKTEGPTFPKWQNVKNWNCPNWKLRQRKCRPESPAFAHPYPSFPPEIWPYYGVWRWGGWLEGDDHRRRRKTISMADNEASGRYNSQTKSLSRADHSTLLGILFGIFRPMNEILLLFSDKICESGWPQSARLYCCRELSHCRNNKSKQISWTD